MSPALRERLRRLQDRRLHRRLAGPKLLQAFGEAYPRAFFVEIGANDGDQHDHLQALIRTREWSGLMVEPVPYVFERLRRNYADRHRVTLENAAIGDRDGRHAFYHLREADPGERDRLPSWYDGIGSLSRANVLAHRRHIPDIDERIVRSEVPCLTFESLCRKHGVERVDLLAIDAEGYDAEILRRIDFGVLRPRLIVYEHFHLEPHERVACRTALEVTGYETIEEGFDTWCLIASPEDRLTRAWRGLRPGVRALSVHEEAR
jgi:FkbM family methyltransferase